MPKRTDLHRILLIGSGPIVIGQGAEFDYSGTQAVKALKEEGYEVVLVNSNPATIMTDPEIADRTYIEPVTPEWVRKVIERERPDALLPTMGGQTALNVAMALARDGTLAQFGVELIGASARAIQMAEDRAEFAAAMRRIGLEVPQGRTVDSLEAALEAVAEVGYPAVIRPSFTLGGTGGGIAYNREEFEELVGRALELSPVHTTLIERSVLGWKEFELEVMRDGRDNVVIVCSIENLDPMGVHTGDSITVAPAMTLTDREYQRMRDAAIAIIREIGVAAGGCNIQFAVSPADGEMLVIEMNPRVSRSSALASKATGFPIARIGTKLAVGFTLDELPNDITRTTPASFEPVLDYVVVKVPRFAFEKFPQASDTIGPQMKSVGEAMAIGRTFKESLQKAMRSLEIGSFGFEPRAAASDAELRERLRVPNADRLWHLGEAFRRGLSVDEVFGLTAIDPWFLRHVEEIVADERVLAGQSVEALSAERLRTLKQAGFADVRLAELLGTTEDAVRARRTGGIEPVYKTVDTCGAEFEAHTPYLYSTYDEGDDEVRPSRRGRKVVILGGGPNRIGQGIEFDYCCVHAALALREDGFETIMVNCNPETVSTDYDTSDKLFFEPLTLEDTLALLRRERPEGVIVQFGGQTPLRLAVPLARAGVPIIGTTPDAIDRAEDRERFEEVLAKLDLRRPPNGVARAPEEAVGIAEALGYPVVVRPSYVLGGRAMEIVHEQKDLERYMREAVKVSNDSPVLLDRFLSDATEVDVDAVSDGECVLIGGVTEHIEQAGVHSGDSACSLPPHSLSAPIERALRRQTVELARALKVVGQMNVRVAIQRDVIYVLEVNPRASRTVPFVGKATGVPLAKIAARCMVGRTLAQQDARAEVVPGYFSVKEAVFPFVKFPGVDTILGPEMKSTGKVMGVGKSFGEAFVKSQLAASAKLPEIGTAFISVRDGDKLAVVQVARELLKLGFRLLATRGTGGVLAAHGIAVTIVNKVVEGRPHIVDMIKNGEVSLVVNTVEETRTAVADSRSIRTSAVQRRVTYYTTVAGARAACEGMRHMKSLVPYLLQELHSSLRRSGPIAKWLEKWSH